MGDVRLSYIAKYFQSSSSVWERRLREEVEGEVEEDPV